MNRRSFLTAAASTLGLLSLAPVARLARAQPFGVSVIDRDWTDARRARQVPIRLYLPSGASPERPAPLVVFSHGMGGSRFGYRYLGSHWASEGFASLHVQHVGSDNSLWNADGRWALLMRMHQAAQESEAIARVRDLRFAIDQLLDGDLGRQIDGGKIIAAGHSYGANTTLLAAGARVERTGLPVDLREPRLRAAIVISAPPFHGESSPERILAGVGVPSLHITGTDDVIRIPGYYSDASDRVAVFNAVGNARKTLAVFAGGVHSMFTDRTAPGGIQLNAQVKSATQELTTSFLRSVVMGDDSSLQTWPQRHGAILSRFVGPVQG
jgi:predicted dienelactone hydrolase